MGEILNNLIRVPVVLNTADVTNYTENTNHILWMRIIAKAFRAIVIGEMGE